MTVVLDPDAAERCSKACVEFRSTARQLAEQEFVGEQSFGAGSFPTALQLGTVYTLFAGEDLRTLLTGFADQADAMNLLFAAAGGLINAQDEAVAAALSKAAAEPAGLQSVGLIHGNASDLINTDEKCVMGGYGRVGPEDVSSSPLERIASCAEALQPQQYMEIQTKAATVADGLSNAAHTLQGELDAVLGHGWQGEFAVNAQASTRALVESAHSLSDELKQVADKASRAHDGLATTQTNIAEYAHQGALAKSQAEMRSFEQVECSR